MVGESFTNSCKSYIISNYPVSKPNHQNIKSTVCNSLTCRLAWWDIKRCFLLWNTARVKNYQRARWSVFILMKIMIGLQSCKSYTVDSEHNVAAQISLSLNKHFHWLKTNYSTLDCERKQSKLQQQCKHRYQLTTGWLQWRILFFIVQVFMRVWLVDWVDFQSSECLFWRENFIGN